MISSANMNIRLRTLFLSVFLTSVLIDSAVAAPIFSQESLPRNPGALSSNHAIVSAGGARIADNFQINGDTPEVLRSLRFVGGNIERDPGNSAPLGLDHFRVEFLTDASNAPGEILTGGSYTNLQATERTRLDGVSLSGFIDAYQYVLELDQPLAILPSTTYWISISNDLSPDYSWRWATTNIGFDDLIYSTTLGDPNGPLTNMGDGRMVFSLHNILVPEPLSCFLLLVGIGYFLCLRKPCGLRTKSIA